MLRIEGASANVSPELTMTKVPSPDRSLPLITVIVPTRERLPVLRHCLNTLTTQRYERLEILVSDNCSTDGTRAFVEGLDDPRVRYVNPGRRCSMTENYEFALSQVRDGWLMYLGDDDGLMPEAVATLGEAIAGTECEAISFRACNYVWPNADDTGLGRLFVPQCQGREIRRGSEWLQRVVNQKADYSDLPNIYTVGIVKRSLMDRARPDGGEFFRSSIPDIYASIALTRLSDTYLYINEPISVIGISKFSNGLAQTASFDKKEGAGEGEYNRFLSENVIPLHPEIPKPKVGGFPASWQMFIYEAWLQSRFLQPGAPELCRRDRLVFALAFPHQPDRYDGANSDWGRDFARMHGIDFQPAWAEAMRLRRKSKLGRLRQRFNVLLESLIVSNAGVSLNDVYSASIVASAVRWMAPSYATRLLHAARHLRRMKSERIFSRLRTA